MRTSRLSEAKHALLEQRLKGKGSATARSKAIPRLSDRRHLPLSFAQQRLWFLHQLEPANPFYNMPAVVGLEGDLDVLALEATLNDLLRRHEALRTTLPLRQGQPIQLIHPAKHFSLPVVDLRHLPAEQRPDVARARMEQEALRPFDLAQGPLLRALLLRLGEREHAFLLTMHHIVSDGWSLGKIGRAHV